MTPLAFVEAGEGALPGRIGVPATEGQPVRQHAGATRPPSARASSARALRWRSCQADQDNLRSKPTIYGAPRIYVDLTEVDVHVGRKRVARLTGQHYRPSPPQTLVCDHQAEPSCRGSGPRHTATYRLGADQLRLLRVKVGLRSELRTIRVAS